MSTPSPADRKPSSPPPDLTMMPPVRTPTPRPVAPPVAGADLTMMPPVRIPTPRPVAPPVAGADLTMLPPASFPTPRPGSIVVPARPAVPPGDMTIVAPASSYRTPRPGSEAQTIVATPQRPVDPAATVAFNDTGDLATQAAHATQATRTTPNLSGDALVVTLDAGLQESRRSVLSTLTTTGDHAGNWRRTLHLPSSTSDGRFSVRRKIAAGGMGAVLEIADQDFGRNAAMKVIKPEARAHPDALVRFLAEARVTAQLEHPNIVPIHDLGTMGDGTLYFTMKFIQGQSFGQVVKKLKEGDPATQAQWSESAILLAFLKVLDGVGFAHARKVVHRDLKPDNVMIGAHGEVLVVDWGIAKVAGQAEIAPGAPTDATILSSDDAGLTMQGQAMGTPMYMPPEQAKGDLASIDARSDIYALGATLYELITLQKSIDADNIATLLYKVTHGETVPVRTARPGVDADLAAIITKAMALAPADRYQSCEAFAADIRLYLGGLAVAARRRSLGEVLRAWVVVHRRQLVAGAVSAGTIAVLAGGFLFWRDLQVKRRVGDLLASARNDLDKGAIQDKGAYDLALLKHADGSLHEAKALAPYDAAVMDLMGKVAMQIGLVERLEKDRLERDKRAAAADQLLAQGRADVAAGRLEQAEQAFTAALKGLPPEAQEPVIKELSQIGSKLADSRHRKLDEEAAGHLQTAADRLKAATGLDLLHADMDGCLNEARKELDLAGKDNRPPPGAAKVAGELALQTQRVQVARKAEEDRKTAAGFATQAQARLDENRNEDARSLAEKALGFDPHCQCADGVRMEAMKRLAKAEEERSQAKTLAELETKAAEALSKAQAAFGRLSDLTGLLLAARARVETLSREYEAKPLAAKAPLWEAHAKAREAEGNLTGAQSTVETEATAAVHTLDTRPRHRIRVEALSLLATYYQAHYDEACEAGDQVGQKAYLALLNQVDDGSRAAHRNETATVTLRGTGTVTVRPLVIGSDTRLQPGGSPQVVSVPADQALGAGRWQLSDERGVVVSVKLEPAQHLTLAWPGDAPRIPGLDFNYVPPPPRGKAFWMGRTEITNEQYLAFLNHPKVLPMVSMQVDVVAKKTPDAVLIQVPRGNPQLVSSILWTIERPAPGQPITRFTLPPEAHPKQPVTGIDRSDAEAYCAWLGEAQGLTVRLPTPEEFRWACQGGDPDRRYPWGNVFDGAFAVTAMGKRTAPALVGTCPTDVGPFGHYDLAGNVREWLAGSSRQGAWIAAAGFGDDNPLMFQAGYTETLKPDMVNPAIGFRVVIEVR